MTRSTACPPNCNPQLPPVIVIGAGALHPCSVRQVATPLPWLPPKPTAILTIDGITAIHFAPLMTLSGIALSGVAMISSRTLADASIRFAISESSLSSADQPMPTNIEQMLNNRRHLDHREESRFIFVLFCAPSEHPLSSINCDIHPNPLTKSRLSGFGSKHQGELPDAVTFRP